MSAVTMVTMPVREFEPYVSADEVASLICASPKTVLRLARLGRIPAHCFGEGVLRRHWRFKLSELDEWMRGRNNAPHGGSIE